MLGFVRGVGLGVLGAAVKPMLGVTDGIASLTHGLLSPFSASDGPARVRPQRTFERSSVDITDLVLVPLNIEASHAQEFVLERAKKHHFHDAFLKFVPLGYGEAVVLSEVYIYWKRGGGRGLWGRAWSDISHVFFIGEAVGIMLYGASAKEESISIPCSNRARAVQLYSALYDNSFRMGNPGNVAPVEVVTQMNHLMTSGDGQIKPTDEMRENYIALQERASSLAGALDGYRFGAFNGEEMTGKETHISDY